jgi:hypothetical protein
MILAIRPVKSTEIRRVVKLAFSQLFTSLTIERGGQFWNYSGNYQDDDVRVSIDYAGRYHQLEYKILVRSRTHGIKLPRLSYEQLMGLSFAYWDCLEQSNLDQSIALLKDLVVFFAELSRRSPI